MHFLAFLSFLSALTSTLGAAMPDVGSTLIARKPLGDDPECVWAGKYHSYTYLGCTSKISYPQLIRQGPGQPLPQAFLSYTIRMSGTGQSIDSWCKSILEAIPAACGKRLIRPQNCRAITTPDWATWAANGDDNNKLVGLYRLELTFEVHYEQGTSFTGSDHDHKCVAIAVSGGTCPTVHMANGAACFSEGDYGNPGDIMEDTYGISVPELVTLK